METIYCCVAGPDIHKNNIVVCLRYTRRGLRGPLKEEALRSGRIVLAPCWMPNRIDALIQTAEPNLASGMQHWLTGTDRVAILVRRADHRRRQSSGWQKTVREITVSLRLNTEHKA